MRYNKTTYLLILIGAFLITSEAFSQIAKLLHRHPSSISREWKRHLKEGNYSPSHAQESYHMAKSHCGRKRMLERDHNLSNTVKHLFLDYQ